MTDRKSLETNFELKVDAAEYNIVKSDSDYYLIAIVLHISAVVVCSMQACDTLTNYSVN